MRALASVALALALVSCCQAQTNQTVDEGALFGDLLTRLTGGDANVTSGASYLYGLGSGLASGFQDTLTDLYQSFLNGTTKDTVESLVQRYEDTFCTNATYTPPSKTPATFTGPGASLTIAGGACVFNQTEFAVSNGDFQIDCVGPSVVISKTPAVFNSESKTPEVFTSSSCSISSAIDDKLSATIDKAVKSVDIFGKAKPEPTTEVLFVFDDKQNLLNFTQIGTQLQSEFESVLGEVNSVLSGNSTVAIPDIPASIEQNAASTISAASGPTIDTLLGNLAHSFP